MSADSKIEWTGHTLNVVTGCTKVSEGCDNCYIPRTPPFRMAGRKFDERGHIPLQFHPDRLDQVLARRKPTLYFVNSLADVFHDDVSDDFIAALWATMWHAPQHTFQILTKRPGRMQSLLSRDDWWETVLVAAKLRGLRSPYVNGGVPDPLPNVWLGVSVESQKWAALRIYKLLETPAAVRFLSCEPLLGPVDLSTFLGVEWMDAVGDYSPEMFASLNGRVGPDRGLHWVIAGGESGPGARPMHPEWARLLRDQCVAAGVPFFFKQWGEWAPVGPLYDQEDDDQQADDARMAATSYEIDGREVVHLERDGAIANDYQPRDHLTWMMARVGKKSAGRDLDGRTWDEMPAVSHGR